MQNLYMISGLGADHRVFSRLKLENYNIIHLSWIENKPHESLEDYARRMAEKIEDPDPLILGLSFGGIVAQEIALQRPVRKLILLSTLSSRTQKPWFFSVVRSLAIHKWIPSFFLRHSGWITDWAFGMKTKEDKAFLQSIFKANKPWHFRWAVDHVLRWNRNYPESPYVHIHGERDRVFPAWRIKDVVWIKKGHHFAVYQQPEATEQEILNALTDHS